MQRRFEERNQKVTITDLTLGYELRCAPPVPFDIDYTRTLGYGAARFLLQDEVEESLELAFRDPDTGRTKVRKVDIQSEGYRVARDYMLRLEKSDLEDPETLSVLADASGIPGTDFKARFWDAVSRQPQWSPTV